MSAPAASKRFRVAQHLLGRSLLAALHTKAADLVHGLRLQTQVRAHGDIMIREELDDLDLARTAFELHHLCAALLHQTHGILERLLFRGVSHERHVRHQERAVQTLRDRLAVIDHVVERDGHGRVVTLDHHAERIADEHEIDTGIVDERREARVIGGDAGDLFAFGLSCARASRRLLAGEARTALGGACTWVSHHHFELVPPSACDRTASCAPASRSTAESPSKRAPRMNEGFTNINLDRAAEQIGLTIRCDPSRCMRIRRHG